MLSRTDDTTTISGSPIMGIPAAAASTASNEELAAFVEGLQDKPLLDFSDFLTSPLESSSPWEDSPFNEFLGTPTFGNLVGSGTGIDAPAVADYDSSAFGDFALFPSMEDYPMDESAVSSKEPSAMTLGREELIKMSPSTPALPVDPNTVFPSPISPPMPSMPPTNTSTPLTTSALAGKRKTIPTGTRKNITPEALVGLDAPTQKRSYISPSVTSRKEVPAVFLRKRARTQAFPEDEDELEEIILGPNATEAEQIEAKRRQNTIAARRSRKRKLAYTRELEDKVESVSEERDLWKNRALACEALLKHHGLEVPEF